MEESKGSGQSAERTRRTAAPDSGRRAVPLRIVATRFDVILVALTALVASVLGRAVAPALPGASPGIGDLITGVDQLAGFSTQFMAVLGVSTCVRLLLSTLDSTSRSFRSVAILSTTLALPMVISASSRHLAPGWLIALAGLSAALGVTAVRPALQAPQSRAAGLMLLLVTLGSLVSAFGRVLALYASQEVEAELFGLARGIATAGLLIDATSVLLAAVWASRRWRLGVGLVSALGSLAAFVVWVGAQSPAPVEGEGWGRFVARALASLTAHPDPFVEAGLRYFIEIYALLVAAVTLWFRRPPGVGEAICFALLARVSGDVPSCALMLILASLCAVRASLQPVRPHGAAPQAAGRRASLEVVPVTR
ncbi:MAG TPA: hypothetical protein VFS67_16885 [Polyangiaceae bacterium]|nr:hypothetical protein [Polyangiaceae bacterium]